MEKYIDADLLRKEIEFAKSVYDNPKRIVVGIADAFRQDGRAAMCDDILKKIDSLQQEQPKANDLDFEQELYNRFGQIKDFTLGMRIGQYFYELGCRRTAEKYDEVEYNRQREEENVPNDLEEAKEAYCEEHNDDCFDAIGSVCPHIIEAFIAGAKWQANHTPLPEDTALFQKGVAEGKRLMMEEAEECELYWDGDFLAIDLNMAALGYSERDKVRVIVLPKED